VPPKPSADGAHTRTRTRAARDSNCNIKALVTGNILIITPTESVTYTTHQALQWWRVRTFNAQEGKEEIKSYILNISSIS